MPSQRLRVCGRNAGERMIEFPPYSYYLGGRCFQIQSCGTVIADQRGKPILHLPDLGLYLGQGFDQMNSRLQQGSLILG
jgi:hypothetical protein